MSEFSKLVARIDYIGESLRIIDLTHLCSPDASDAIVGRESMEVDSTIVSTGKELFVSKPLYGQAGAAMQSMSTTTSATPDFRSQWAWRSTSSTVRAEADEFESAVGHRLSEDCEATRMLIDELSTKTLPSCGQFTMKANTKDPLTDLPRFGTAMRAKIIAASEKAQFCFDFATKIIEKLETLTEEENNHKRDRRLQAERQTSEALKEREEQALAVFELNKVSE